MKTNLRISRFLAISVLALALPMSAMARGHGNDRGSCGMDDRPGIEMQRGYGMSNLRGIDLSAAQVTQLTALRDEQRKLFSEKGQAMREQHDALRKLVMSDAYTPAAAAEIIARIGAAQTEMAKLRAEQGNKLYKLLTPEQRIKAQQNELTGSGSMGHGRMR
jgi:protein CpxP